MKENVKQSWVAALRSGDYRQGRQRLRTVTGDDVQFCCLGVLCELAIEAGIVRRDGHYGYHAVDDENDVASGSLPDAVVRWADLPSGDPSVTEGDDEERPLPLSYLNDIRAGTFNQIADLIEAQL